MLSPPQLALLDSWLPGAVLVHDHSSGLTGTTVLELLSADGAVYIVKAGAADDHHIARELAAHRQWVAVWAATGRAPRLVQGDVIAKLLVTEYLPGDLVEGSEYEWTADTYRQAGELLARFHGQHQVDDDGAFERHQKQKTLDWLGRPHRIAPEAAIALRRRVEEWPTPRSVVVPTHGDWQPRNWLVDHGRIGVIGLGRAGLRPRHTDLGRLAVQQFKTDPLLEQAFLHGYGDDPRQPDAWLRLRIRDAVGTAAWAYQVGDLAFEQQGHQMIAAILAELGEADQAPRVAVPTWADPAPS